MYRPSVPCATTGLQGLGCPGCGGKCGVGIFDSGMDVSQWGAIEWGAALLGGYVLFSVFAQTKRAAGAVRKYRRRRKS